MMKLNPLEAAMGRLLEQLCAKDPQEIFAEPVDTEEVPDYMDVVKNPMDFSTMRAKLRSGEYTTLDVMEQDFNLMVQNCLAYNNKDTIFYRAGIKMRDQGAVLFKAARKDLIKSGIVEEPQSDESLANEIDVELALLLNRQLSNEKLIEQLQILMEKATRIKHASIRGKRVKQIRAELVRAKKSLNKSSTSVDSPMKSLNKSQNESTSSSTSETSESDEEPERTTRTSISKQQTTPPTSPAKIFCNSASPSGVNRRTAVLFTRKAQAASIKKNESSMGNEDGASSSSFSLQAAKASTSQGSSATSSLLSPISHDNRNKSPKKLSRGRRNTSKSIEGMPFSFAEPGPSNLSTPLSSFLERKNTSPNALSTPVTAAAIAINKKITPVKEKFSTSDAIPDSFRCYRGPRLGLSSDTDDSQLSFSDSTCSSCSGSGSEFG